MKFFDMRDVRYISNDDTEPTSSDTIAPGDTTTAIDLMAQFSRMSDNVLPSARAQRIASVLSV